MSEMSRRSFLSTAWKVSIGFLAAAGVITSWDLLKPQLAAGVDAIVRTVKPEAVPTSGVLEVPEARGYLVKTGDGVIALSEVCTHLGCRVPYIDENNQFECPCRRLRDKSRPHVESEAAHICGHAPTHVSAAIN